MAQGNNLNIFIHVFNFSMFKNHLGQIKIKKTINPLGKMINKTVVQPLSNLFYQ